MPGEPRPRGLRRLFRLPRPVERDVNDEIAFHLDSRVRELILHGYSLDRARRVAETEFGDVSASRRELTAVDRQRRRREALAQWWDAVTHDLRFAARSLRHSPAFTITGVLTLVIGVGACATVFTVVHAVLLRPLPYGHPDRLVSAWHDFPPIGLMHGAQSASTYLTYKRMARTIDGIGIYDEDALNVAQPGRTAEPERVTAAFVSRDLIPLLEVAPILGRSFTEIEDRPNGPPVLMIGEGMWRARFGADPAILGRSLDVDGVTCRIVGVMPKGFRFPTHATQLWLPLALDPVALDGRAFTHNGIVRLKAGVSVATAQREFASLLPRVATLYPRFVPGISTQAIMDQVKPRPVLVPLRDDVTGPVAPTLWMVAASAVLLLLVACANVANLTLVRADARQREMAVREALGAGRARVVLHFFAESALLAGLAALVGLVVTTGVTRWLVATAPVPIPRLEDVRVDGSTVLFLVVVAALLTILCGAVPAARALGRQRILADGNRGGTIGRAQRRLRSALVVGQIALALLVLSTSGLLLRTFERLHAVRPGFDPTHLATLWTSLPTGRYASDTAVVQFFAELTDRVRRLPGVQGVAVTSRLPLERFGMDQNPLYPEADPSFANRLPPLQLFTAVDGEYFHTMGIPVLVGRTFDAITAQREREAIVSLETAAYFWKDSTGVAALGKRFRPLPNSPLYTVIGVVGNARDTALAVPPSPTVYFPEVAGPGGVSNQLGRTMALVVRVAGNPAAIEPTLRGIVREMDVTLPVFDAKPMTVAFEESTAQLTFTIAILGSAAVVTLLLGTIGLYGVLAYLVTLRRRELGVRMALGASPYAIAAGTTRYGLVLTAGGILTGLVAFALIARFLRVFLFGVTPADPLTLITAIALLLAIGTVATWMPARRAARVDPADALRIE